MIKMKQPALVVHSHDVPGYKYQMMFTWKLLPKATPKQIVNWILNAKDGYFGAKRNRLENLIINCHGGPGKLYIGGKRNPAFDIMDVHYFSVLRRLNVGTIWLVACQVADQEGVATGGLGKMFCTALAQESGCDVIASACNQYVNPGFYLRGSPFGFIDGFEGLTYRFKPNGDHAYFVS
jgi:hypothetical protein